MLQTLCSPTLIAPTPGRRREILDLVISLRRAPAPPVDVDLLGLRSRRATSTPSCCAETGDGQILGNLLYNVANLLNPGGTTTLLLLLTQLAACRRRRNRLRRIDVTRRRSPALTVVRPRTGNDNAPGPSGFPGLV